MTILVLKAYIQDSKNKFGKNITYSGDWTQDLWHSSPMLSYLS